MNQTCINKKIRESLTYDDSSLNNLLNLINEKQYDEANNLVLSSHFENTDFYKKHNIFNILLNKIVWDSLAENRLMYTTLLLSLLKNDNFVLNCENIRKAVCVSPKLFFYNNLIIERIIHQNLLNNLSVAEKTNLILMLSEYEGDETLDENYQIYMKLFSEDCLSACQEYFIHNYKSYFDNCIFSDSCTDEVTFKISKFIETVLINKTYCDEGERLPKQPNQNSVLIGGDIKYINMIVPLLEFHKKQKKLKSTAECLFKNPKEFFILFSFYIKPHKSFDENFEIYLKELQVKYNLASISWDNRYFHGREYTEFKFLIEESLQKILNFFTMKDLHSVHLQFKSPGLTNNYGYYHNLFNIEVYKNIHIIALNVYGKKTFNNLLVHEFTHFLQYQKINKNCFSNDLFKRLKDKIYLHNERAETILKLSEILENLKDKVLVKKIELLFNDYLHLMEKDFKVKFENLLTKHVIDDDKKQNILDIFIKYKSYNYKSSKQYLIWGNIAKDCGLGASYFNKSSEIHARLNEILSGTYPQMSSAKEYLTIKSIDFNLLKDDLVKFNEVLVKKYLNSRK